MHKLYLYLGHPSNLEGDLYTERQNLGLHEITEAPRGATHNVNTPHEHIRLRCSVGPVGVGKWMCGNQ